ncbi:unnamed protein product [Sphacelaria rigidula]
MFLKRLVVMIMVGATTVLAEFGVGDIISMEYTTRQSGGGVDGEGWNTPWDQARRSHLPRYGQPATLTFTPGLPGSYKSTEELAVAMAFAHERFMVPWVTVREAGGKDRLHKLVLTFICAAGEIVRIRSTPTYVPTGDSAVEDNGVNFQVEYRWDRLPEEDEQAGISVIFAVCLILTVFLAFDVCNNIGEDKEDGIDRDRYSRERFSVGEQRRRR